MPKNSPAVAGIDVGSVTTKVVIVALQDRKILAQAISSTRADPKLAANSVLEEALKKASLSRDEIAFIVSTGYGRRAIDFSNKPITEITANAVGAQFLGSPWGKIRTIIDLGGQDSKAIKLDEHGAISDFVMNDKCAAGTGRFLEVIAQTLDVKLDDLGNYSLKSTNPIKINATCTVFAESEIISLVAQREKKEDILAGLNETIARRIGGMAKSINPEGLVFFDGGGARNIGIKTALERELGLKIYVPPEPQFVIALGAALIAAESFSANARSKDQPETR